MLVALTFSVAELQHVDKLMFCNKTNISHSIDIMLRCKCICILLHLSETGHPPDDLHPECPATLCSNSKAGVKKTRTRVRDIPFDLQHLDLGDEHLRGPSIRRQSGFDELLRTSPLEHHHPRGHTSDHIPPVPRHRVPVHYLENCVQTQGVVGSL